MSLLQVLVMAIVFYYERGRIMMKLRMRKGMAMLVVLCMLLMLMPVSVFATYVASDISGHWAEYEIQSWIDKSLIEGYPDGSFKPDQNVTRAEFMTLVNRAFGYIEVVAIDYLDVQAESWYALEVAKAEAARYIIGYPDGTIKPENSISREEAAIIIWRLKNLAYDAAAVSKYSDALNINSWSEREVGAVTSAGIMQGYPDGSFRPQGDIKRGEAVEALDNALNYTAPAETADATVTSSIGTVGADAITNIPFVTTLAAFKTAITPATGAIFNVYDANGTDVATVLTSASLVKVMAEDRTTLKTYTVAINAELSYVATVTSK